MRSTFYMKIIYEIEHKERKSFFLLIKNVEKVIKFRDYWKK